MGPRREADRLGTRGGQLEGSMVATSDKREAKLSLLRAPDFASDEGPLVTLL